MLDNEYRGIYTAFSYILFISLIISYVTEIPSPYIYIIGTNTIVLIKNKSPQYSFFVPKCMVTDCQSLTDDCLLENQSRELAIHIQNILNIGTSIFNIGGQICFKGPSFTINIHLKHCTRSSKEIL